MITLQHGQTSIIEGILTKTVEFYKDGKLVTIPKGKQVTVDPTRNVALFGDDHFQIDEDEYVAVYQN